MLLARSGKSRDAHFMAQFRISILTDIRMTSPRPTEKVWMKQTVEESIMASLQRRISRDDLLDEQWLKFKDAAKVGDELWYFRTPQETWTEFFPRCGMEGYALIRGDKVVAETFTSIS